MQVNRTETKTKGIKVIHGNSILFLLFWDIPHADGGCYCVDNTYFDEINLNNNATRQGALLS